MWILVYLDKIFTALEWKTNGQIGKTLIDVLQPLRWEFEMVLYWKNVEMLDRLNKLALIMSALLFTAAKCDYFILHL